MTQSTGDRLHTQQQPSVWNKRSRASCARKDHLIVHQSSIGDESDDATFAVAHGDVIEQIHSLYRYIYSQRTVLSYIRAMWASCALPGDMYMTLVMLTALAWNRSRDGILYIPVTESAYDITSVIAGWNARQLAEVWIQRVLDDICNKEILFDMRTVNVRMLTSGNPCVSNSVARPNNKRWSPLRTPSLSSMC